MGLEYRLVDMRRRVAFELGKGLWGSFLTSWALDPPAFPAERILDTVAKALDGSLAWYQCEAARRIVAFVEGAAHPEDLRLANDAEHDREFEFPVIGSRYGTNEWVLRYLPVPASFLANSKGTE